MDNYWWRGRFYEWWQVAWMKTPSIGNSGSFYESVFFVAPGMERDVAVLPFVGMALVPPPA